MTSFYMDGFAWYLAGVVSGLFWAALLAWSQIRKEKANRNAERGEEETPCVGA